MISTRRARFLIYMMLRAATAAGTLLTGFCQTYTFARVLAPDRFSVFILIGNLGLSLWLFDLGVAKVLFVNLRETFLADRLKGDVLQVQAGAVAVLYALLVLVGALFCATISALALGGGSGAGLQYGLFFIYSALNLVWYALRNVSVASDRFLFFESLEVVRRVGHLALMFCLFLPIPFTFFLILSNFLWVVLLAVLVGVLARADILRLDWPEMPSALMAFFRRHRIALWGSGKYAAGELYNYNFPSVLVPAVHGLGAPTIIFDTAFKIFRGANVVFSASSDLWVPRQTEAFAAADRRALWQATGGALLLGLVPALLLVALLLAYGNRLYHLLLGHAAVMPTTITPVLVLLILCNLVQTVANFVLIHTGHFTHVARLAMIMVLVMTGVAAIDATLRLSIVQFLTVYAGAYLISATLYAAAAIRHPLGAWPLPIGERA